MRTVCGLGSGQVVGSVWSHHFDPQRHTDCMHTPLPTTPAHDHNAGSSHSRRMHARNVPPQPIDPRTHYTPGPIRARRHRTRQQAPRSARPVTTRRGRKHRRLREQTTTPGEWLRIARAQTLARVGGSGSAHRPMRNATSKRNGSKHTKTSMPLRSSGAGTSAIEQRAEEGDHAQQSTEAMVSSPHMQQIRLTCSPDPSAACARMRVTTLSFGTCSRHLCVPVHTAKTVGPAR